MTSAAPPKTGTTTDSSPKTLRYRVTKKGHGQIFTGTNDPKTFREIRFNEGDEFDGPAENREVFEERGLAKVITPLPEELLPQPEEPRSEKPRNQQGAPLQDPPLTSKAASVADPEAMARLAARARRDDATGCLIWQGSKANGGYGQITYRRKLHTTHRLAWTAQHGEVPANHYVCHACDNPACIAIEHLFLGTPQDNYRDMRKKGRSRYNSKLETHEVAAIKKRLAQGEPAVKVAKDYAVRYDQILNIKRGTAWREVAAEGTE